MYELKVFKGDDDQWYLDIYQQGKSESFTAVAINEDDAKALLNKGIQDITETTETE